MGESRRIGLELAGEPSVPEMVRLAQAAEALGYESVWCAETRFTRDAVVPAAAIATATDRIGIGTAVVNPFTRGAVLTAATFAGLDEAAGGRFLAGIGPGSPTVLAQQGIAFERPLARLEEAVTVIRRLIAGERVDFAGSAIEVRGVQLDFAPARPAIPIYLGVTGPRALALAGRIADGALLNAFVSLDYTRRAIAAVRQAADEAGRDPDDVDIAASIVVAVDDDPAAARDAARPQVATYLARFPNIARESGLAPDALDRVAAAYHEGGEQAAAQFVDDAVVEALVCCGTAADCRRQLDRRRAAGVALPVVSLVARDPGAWLAALADRA